MIISVVIALFLFIIPEAQTQESLRINVSDVFDIFKDKKAKYMIWANVLLSLPTIFFYNYVSINFSSLGISQNNISVFYSVVAAGSIAAGVLISVFSDKFGKRKMSYLSTILSGLALIPFVFMSKNLLVIGFVFGLFYDTIWGLFYPVGSTFYLHKRATFLTILSSVTSLTNLLSNATGPLIYQFGGFSLLMIISAVGLVASGVYMMRAFVLDGNKNN
jgi:predicted MFS family arabinose efflux permease